MSETTLPYEIREVPDAQGGLRLELHVEGERVSTASATAEVLDAIHARLGVSREDMADELRKSLLELLKGQLEKVTITRLKEDPHQTLKFWSKYSYRDFDNIGTGLTWYDVQSSETGPEDAPAVVRNRLRYEVHRRLTSEGSRAREILDLSR